MKSYVSDIVSKVLQEWQDSGAIAAVPAFDVTVPKENLGDYSTNAAFVLAKTEKQNPNALAEKLAAALPAADADGAFSAVSAAGGFVNVSLAPEYLARSLYALQRGIPLHQFGAGKKVVFEYSSPNTNKPLHIGHTRNDLYGKACINLLRASGFDVLACEVINDRGVHIMKSMLMYMLHGGDSTPESAGMKPDHFVGTFYAMFAAAAEKDPSLNDQTQEMLQKWEAGDEAVRTLWTTMNNWFYAGVEETYRREGTSFDHIDHESQIYGHGKDVVQDGVRQGVFNEEEDGSVSVNLTDQGLDKKYLLRKDGTSMYVTQDVYLWQDRAKTFEADEMFVVTASEQGYHFQVLKEIFRLLKYPWAESFHHLPYEYVNLGKEKMSSRLGNTVSADDLLKDVKERVRATMLESERIKGSVDDDALVEAVAFSAIKYGYLKYDSNTKIYFDMDETVAVEGNTGPYVQYAHARIRSILSKAGVTSLDEGIELLDHPAERSLSRHLGHYADIVAVAARDHKPSVLCAYLHEVASKFNTLYDQVHVLNAETEELKIGRLSLLASTAAVLANGLELLGIVPLDVM